MDSRVGGGCGWSVFGDQTVGVWPKKVWMESFGSGGPGGAQLCAPRVFRGASSPGQTEAASAGLRMCLSRDPWSGHKTAATAVTSAAIQRVAP